MNHLLERIKAPLGTAMSRQEPGGGCLARSSAELARVGSNMLALPFDIARAQYAKAVQLGLIERSLIASARFGQTLDALEKLTLGPLARKY